MLEDLAEVTAKAISGGRQLLSPTKPMLCDNLQLSATPGNYIFVIGGIGEPTKLSTILRYDIAQNKWEDTKTPLHINRGGVFYDKSNQIITVVGGKKETQLISKVYNLNPVNNDLQVEDNSAIKIRRSGFGFLQTDSRLALTRHDVRHRRQ